MMKKIKKNIILLISLFFILLSGIYSFFKMPEGYSYFENRGLTEKPHFYFGDYLSGKFQDNLEKSLSDQFVGSQAIKIHYKEFTNFLDFIKVDKIICKNNYLALNDSTYTYDCNKQLIKEPMNEGEIEAALISKSKMYSYINNKYNVYYYFIEDSSIYDFKNNSKKFDFALAIREIFNGPFHVSQLNIENYTDNKKYFYMSDHHWNQDGAYAGYAGIMNLLLPEEKKLMPIEEYHAKDYRFYGSNAKQVRKLDCYDEFWAYEYDLPDYTTFINRKNMDYGESKKIESDYKYMTYDNLYALYYGSDYGEIVFDSSNKEKENLLVLSNSFSNPLNKLIASYFNKTYVVDLRHYENNLGIEFNIDKYILENDINKILVLGNSSYFINDEFNFKVGEYNGI